MSDEASEPRSRRRLFQAFRRPGLGEAEGPAVDEDEAVDPVSLDEIDEPVGPEPEPAPPAIQSDARSHDVVPPPATVPTAPSSVGGPRVMASPPPAPPSAPPPARLETDAPSVSPQVEVGPVSPPPPATPTPPEPEEPAPATTAATAPPESLAPPITGGARHRPGLRMAPRPAVELPEDVPRPAGDGVAPAATETGEEEAGQVELELPRVIAIANQKGGVGKTTTAVNLGAALAEAGYRVLVVDLDPQGNATTGLGVNPRDVGTSIYDVIMSDIPAEDCVEPTSLKNLFIIPATIDLAGAEIELVPAFSRELRLKRALDTLRSEYDILLIDCPPSLGLLTVNGLAAADDVIVPIQCEYYALEGLGQLLRNVSLVRSNLNPTLDVRGIVLTMYDARTKLAEQVETEVREHFGGKVYRTVVPRTVRLSEAPSFGQPIIVFDSTSRGATAYRDLAREVSGGATRRAR
jgi:chromosome partitioning protein